MDARVKPGHDEWGVGQAMVAEASTGRQWSKAGMTVWPWRRILPSLRSRELGMTASGRIAPAVA
jgi:hypothetical protein